MINLKLTITSTSSTYLPMRDPMFQYAKHKIRLWLVINPPVFSIWHPSKRWCGALLPSNDLATFAYLSLLPGLEDVACCLVGNAPTFFWCLDSYNKMWWVLHWLSQTYRSPPPLFGLKTDSASTCEVVDMRFPIGLNHIVSDWLHIPELEEMLRKAEEFDTFRT